MRNDTISRRAMLPAAVAGAATLALTEPGNAAPTVAKRRTAYGGPCRLGRGESLTFSFIAPMVRGVGTMSLQLSFFTIGGVLIGTAPHMVAPGGGASSTLMVFEDGSAKLDGRALEFTVGDGQFPGIIAVLVGLMLSAVCVGTLEHSKNIRTPVGEGPGPAETLIELMIVVA